MAPPTAGRGAATRVERLTAAAPVLALFAVAVLVYAWFAWLVQSPFIFTDELELTQLARSVAETGVPARRGDPAFGSVVAFLLAPAWLVADTGMAYEVAKYLGVIAMTAAVFPAYALARMVTGRRAALFAAAGTVLAPALAYSALMLEEPYAYLASTAALFLVVRALAAPSRGTVAAALAACVVAAAVRQQLVLLPVVFALAAAALWWAGDRGRRLRAGWSAWDRVGAVVLLVGATVAVNAFLAHRSVAWQTATGPFKDRTLEYGLWAGGALAIGLGVLPVVVGLALLASPSARRTGPAARPFVVVLGSAVVAFGFYTAVKASYLSTVFATRVVERNLIYLVPLFFVATAMWLERPRLRIPALVAAAAFVLLLLVVTPIQLDFPYFEAMGFSVLALLNRELYFSAESLETILLVALGISVALALLLRAAHTWVTNAARVLAAATAVTLLAWTFTGAVYAEAGARHAAGAFVANLPKPVDWLDRETGGRPALYLGQNIADPNGIHLLEFWNRSLEHVWSLDGSAPGPGPVVTPDLATATGELFPDPGIPYVVAEGEIEVVGEELARKGGWTLYEVEPPLRLAYSRTGVFSDGWMGEFSAHNRFATPDGRPGTMKVVLSRLGWGGTDVPGRVEVHIGPLAIGADDQPALAEATATCRWTARASEEHICRLPTPPPPFRVEVHVAPTFVPAELDERISDRRALGVQVGYEFLPRDAAQR